MTAPDTTPALEPASLTAWRERMGLSTRAAAIALGCSREGLARWERGDVPIPGYIALACTALEHGLTADSRPKPKKRRTK